MMTHPDTLFAAAAAEHGLAARRANRLGPAFAALPAAPRAARRPLAMAALLRRAAHAAKTAMAAVPFTQARGA